MGGAEEVPVTSSVKVEDVASLNCDRSDSSLLGILGAESFESLPETAFRSDNSLTGTESSASRSDNSLTGTDKRLSAPGVGASSLLTATVLCSLSSGEEPHLSWGFWRCVGWLILGAKPLSRCPVAFS